MKPKARFIKSIVEAARHNQTVMPWARGNRHALRAGARRLQAVPAQVRTA